MRRGQAGRQTACEAGLRRTRDAGRLPHLVDVHGRDGGGGHCRMAGGVGQ